MQMIESLLANEKATKQKSPAPAFNINMDKVREATGLDKPLRTSNQANARQIFSNDLFLSLERKEEHTTKGQTTVSTLMPGELEDLKTSRLIMNERQLIIN